MRGIDTNVLVRYILQDERDQSRKATQFIENECSIEEPAFINGIILCELVWVLESAYDYPRQAIAIVIEKILKTRQFYVQHPEIIWQVLSGYQKEGADFADHYVAILNIHNDCEYTVTFDKKAARLNYFKQLS